MKKVQVKNQMKLLESEPRGAAQNPYRYRLQFIHIIACSKNLPAGSFDKSIAIYAALLKVEVEIETS